MEMGKIHRKIRRWFNTHKPKMLFCQHEYHYCGESCGPEGIFISYWCRKCGQYMNMESEHTVFMRTRKKE